MILSKVGAKTWKTRLALGLIYATLIFGAATMIYPFMLMLTGSTGSEADAASISIYPEFWTDDTMLFRKYAESKHNTRLENIRAAWGGPVTNAPSWRRVGCPLGVQGSSPAEMEEMIAAFRAWRETPGARELGLLGHVSGARILPKNARLWRHAMEKKFNGDLDAYCRVFGIMLVDWSGVVPPVEVLGKARRAIPGDEAAQIWKEFKDSRPAEDLFFIPLTNQRNPAEAFAEFFGSMPCMECGGLPPLCGGSLLPCDGGASNNAAASRLRKAGASARTPYDFGELAAAVDWSDCLANSGALRREFTFRNYLDVLGFIALRGNGVRNTLIYCLLAVLAAIIVNPLAAYALSRFNLPFSWQILLFCMATMAFPGEVTMIPSFILLKRFPLWPLVAATAAMIAMYWCSGALVRRKKHPLPENARLLLSLLAGLFAGGMVFSILGVRESTTSLLNTFAALILPGMANGYFIFLLKGFFDSMPKEIYEAADIDGAGEWTKFWTLTIGLSKPIMAVIALGAFTGAYSAFMMALIIIPDQKMWTLMVWIFQLQSQAHSAVVYASIVLAAIPTFAVFVFCQNLIIRGIVIPTEK